MTSTEEPSQSLYANELAVQAQWQEHAEAEVEIEEGGGELQYDEASNLYYDASVSPIKYFHWNPKEQHHMLVVIPDSLIDEWGYLNEESTDVDVNVLVQHSKKKKKMSNKRKKMKEEKFLAKQSRTETDSPIDAPVKGTSKASSLSPDRAQTSLLPSPSEPSHRQNGNSSRRTPQQIYLPPHLRQPSALMNSQQYSQTAQIDSQQYTQTGTDEQYPQYTQNAQAYAYPNSSYYDQQPYNALTYNESTYNDPQSSALDNTQYSQNPSATLPSPAPVSEPDDVDLQPRSYRDYAEGNYNEYAFPGNDSSSLLPTKDGSMEETEEDEEDLNIKKKKKKQKQKADEPVTYDYTYYAKLFSKHVQADYKVGEESDFAYNKDEKQQDLQPNTNLENNASPLSSATDQTATNPADSTSFIPAISAHPTNPTNPINPTNPNSINPTDTTEASATQYYNSLTPEQQQYLIQYYQYYQQTSATPQPLTNAQSHSIPATSPTLPTIHPSTNPQHTSYTAANSANHQASNRGVHADTKAKNNGNGESLKRAREIHDLEYDVTSQLYYLRSKGWYYDQNTALYLL